MKKANDSIKLKIIKKNTFNDNLAFLAASLIYDKIVISNIFFFSGHTFKLQVERKKHKICPDAQKHAHCLQELQDIIYFSFV